MSEATAIYDVRAAAPIVPTVPIGARPRPVPAAREVREDKPFYIPDYLSKGDHEARPAAYAAAYEHAKQLQRAEALFDQALNLVGVLRASLGDEGDTREMQAETMLDVIETKLGKGRDRLDRHAARYKNLFLAYYELQRNS